LEEKTRIFGSHGFRLDLKPHKIYIFDISTKFYKKSSPKTLNLVNIKKKNLREQTLNNGNRIFFALKTEIVTKLTK
jgi:hypothetical protein